MNYLGSGESVAIPRVEWGVGMGRKQINGGLNMRTDAQPVSPCQTASGDANRASVIFDFEKIQET